MDNSRLIAIACGLIVMLMIIMVCRSCMGKPDTSGLKKPQKNEPALTGIAVETGAPVTEPPELDIFGRPVTTIPQPATELTSEITTGTADTDVSSNTITATTGETDVPDTTETAETVETSAFPETTTEAVAEIPTSEVEEPTLSPVEQYEKDLNDPHSIGGFNHGQYDEEGNPVPTIPHDFTIIIN